MMTVGKKKMLLSFCFLPIIIHIQYILKVKLCLTFSKDVFCKVFFNEVKMKIKKDQEKIHDTAYIS